MFVLDGGWVRPPLPFGTSPGEPPGLLPAQRPRRTVGHVPIAVEASPRQLAPEPSLGVAHGSAGSLLSAHKTGHIGRTHGG